MKNFTLDLLSRKTNFTQRVFPPIEFHPDKKYEVAFLSLEAYNSIPNITIENNKFKYSTDGGTSWKIITLEKGAYEYDEISNNIQKQMIINNDYDEETNSFYIKFSHETLHSVIEITHPDYKIDFNVENSIGSTFGFNKETLSAGIQMSPAIVDINKVNAILVHVDFINGRYVTKLDETCTLSQCIYKFAPNANPGEMMEIAPNNVLMYHPIGINNIREVRVWLTDQDYNPIDLQGERLTISLNIREDRD